MIMRNEIAQNSFDLQLQYTSAHEPVRSTTGSHQTPLKNEQPSAEVTHAWISAFNTSLLTTRANHVKNRAEELNDLMQTPEFASLLVGAQHLAETQGLSKEEATERLIDAFRKIDRAWKQVVMNRGLQSLIE